ncbi:hypothetical protein [Sphingobium sp. CR28]|uniref:hypothetical protein n=1 Tax=Sphingobium sp. CR28 TaxID=3400272 RepID=UPI003FF0B5F7
MTVSALLDLLIIRLVRTYGGTKQQWRKAIGPVKVHDRATHSHCNWSVSPSGTAQRNAAIEQLLDTVRLDHPIVDED